MRKPPKPTTSNKTTTKLVRFNQNPSKPIRPKRTLRHKQKNNSKQTQKIVQEKIGHVIKSVGIVVGCERADLTARYGAGLSNYRSKAVVAGLRSRNRRCKSESAGEVRSCEQPKGGHLDTVNKGRWPPLVRTGASCQPCSSVRDRGRSRLEPSLHPFGPVEDVAKAAKFAQRPACPKLCDTPSRRQPNLKTSHFEFSRPRAGRLDQPVRNQPTRISRKFANLEKKGWGKGRRQGMRSIS